MQLLMSFRLYLRYESHLTALLTEYFTGARHSHRRPAISYDYGH